MNACVVIAVLDSVLWIACFMIDAWAYYQGCQVVRVCLATDIKDDHVRRTTLVCMYVHTLGGGGGREGIYHYGEMLTGDVCPPRPIWFELDAYEPSLFEAQWSLISMNFPLIRGHYTCGRQILVYRMAMPRITALDKIGSHLGTESNYSMKKCATQ